MRIQQKTIAVALFVLVGCVLPIRAYIIGDGRGLFRVAVQVQQLDTGGSIEGAIVTVTDSGVDAVKNDREMKRLAPLFEPAITNVAGQTVVYYFGGFSFETDKGQTQSVRGKLRITKTGYVDVEIDLPKVLGTSFKTEEKVAVCG